MCGARESPLRWFLYYCRDMRRAWAVGRDSGLCAQRLALRRVVYCRGYDGSSVECRHNKDSGHIFLHLPIYFEDVIDLVRFGSAGAP